MTPEPWDKQANFAKLERFARQAGAQGAQVIAAPEGFLEGYAGNQRRMAGLTRGRYASAAAERLDGPLPGRVRHLAHELNVYLITGFAGPCGGHVYNSAAIFATDGER